MAGVDKRAEIVRRPEAARRREQRNRLIPPRAVERILHDRQHLDMGEAHIGDIRDEFARHFAIGQIASAFRFVAPPGAEMGLVDRDRRLAVVTPPAFGHPCAVVPDMPRRPGDDRRRAGRRLRLCGIRVGLEWQQPAVGAHDLVFVEMARPQVAARRSPSADHLDGSRIGIRRPSQSLKSPTRLTRRALGAQTAKATPSTPSCTSGWAPSF